MPARSSASRSWTAPASTRCGWPSITSPPSASAPRCTWWARWPPRAPSGCASARRCRWRRSIIRCGSPRRWRCSTCCRAAASTGAPAAASPVRVQAFGVPPEESAERFREAVEIVLQGLDRGALQLPRARTSRFDDVEVLPKPLQRPHPPVWMAATSETRDRLGGEPRLFHPDGPARLDGGARRQAPALHRASSPKRASPMPAATSRWRGCWRWRRPRPRPRPSRAEARNGWSIPTPGRSTPSQVACSADLRRQGAGAALPRQRHPARHAGVGRRPDRAD